MSKAATQIMLTEHGGIILGGSPNVTINGLPAARLGDYHFCVQHSGGPVSEGARNVTINSLLAARLADHLICLGYESTVKAKLRENWKRLFDAQATQKDPANLSAWQADTGVVLGLEGKGQNNPYYGISKEAMWAAYKAAALTRSPPEEVLALWAKEGYVAHAPETMKDGVGSSAPTPELAKADARSSVYYNQLGMDHFIAYTHVPGHDNDPVQDYSEHDRAFLNAISGLSQYDEDGARAMAASVNHELQVTGAPGNYVVTPTEDFYVKSFVLSRNFFDDLKSAPFSQLNNSSPSSELNYLQWNMGASEFANLLVAANAETGNRNDAAAIENWALHTRPPSGSWFQARKNAIKFAQYIQAFRKLFDGVKVSIDAIVTGSPNVFIGR